MDEARRFKIDKTKSQDSRYKNLDRIVYEDGTEIIESQERVMIKKSLNDNYHEVGPGEEGRLDLISYKYYKTPLYWWCIAIASGIEDPLTVKAGQKLRIPAMSTLTSLKGVLR